METPPSSTAGTVVFLLESKNWENGSNNYITDATKQAGGAEGSGKCFHLRVLSQTVKCTVGWGKPAHPFVSIRVFFGYRRVYLSASVTWAVWTSAACLGRGGYFPSPYRKFCCLRTPHTPPLGPSPHQGQWNPSGLLWGLCTPLACGESSICVHLIRWQDPASELKNNDFNRPSSGMSTAKAWGEAQRLSLCSADHWLKPGKNVCFVPSVVCVDVSGTRRSDLSIHCCQKGIVSLFPSVFHMEPCSLQSLHGGSAHTIQVSEMVLLFFLWSDKWNDLNFWWRCWLISTLCHM